VVGRSAVDLTLLHPCTYSFRLFFAAIATNTVEIPLHRHYSVRGHRDFPVFSRTQTHATALESSSKYGRGAL
jgi:hypothetical protein